MWSGAVIFGIVLCCTTSHPLGDISNNGRPARQLDFGECCPCPDSSSSRPVESTNIRMSNTDDCPCRSRSADSEGASSFLFQTAQQPSLQTADSIEDSTNLLKPEVHLATSVLETLRDVTDEEYQEALARDAARAAQAEYEGPRDTSGAESDRNIVTIIVNPKESDSFDDVMPEASHVQEARCVSPLGTIRSNLKKMRNSHLEPTNLLRELFKVPKSEPLGLLQKNLMERDSHIGASTVQERVVNTSDGTNSTKFARILKKPLLKLFNDNRNIPSTLLSKSESDNVCQENANDATTLNSFSPTATLNKQSFQEPLEQNSDLSQAPSNIEERLEKEDCGERMQTPASELGSLVKQVGNSMFLQKKADRLKHLLKLKDVELIPPMNSRDKTILDRLKLRPIASESSQIGKNTHTHLTGLNDLIRNGIKFNFNRHSSIGSNDSNEKLREKASSYDNSKIRNVHVSSEGLSSASDDVEQLSAKNENCAVNQDSFPQSFAGDIDKNTDLDPSASEDHPNMVPGEVINSDEAHYTNLINDNEDNEFEEKTDSQLGNPNEELELIDTPDKQTINSRKDNENDRNVVNHNIKECSADLNQERRAKSSSIKSHIREPEFAPTEDSKEITLSDGTKTIVPVHQLLPPVTNIKPQNSNEENFEEHHDTLADTLNRSSIVNVAPAVESITPFLTKNEEENSESTDSITIEDLQKLSDSILNLSSQKVRESETVTDMAQENIKPPETFDSKSSSSDFLSRIEDGARAKIEQVQSSNEVTEENPCINGKNSSMETNEKSPLPKANNSESTRQVEMVGEASNPLVNVMAEEPFNLFSSRDPFKIVQPSDLISKDLNVLKPSLDINNLGLPTLDDLKSSLSILNIFDAKDRDVGTERSADAVCNTDIKPVREMLSAASSPILKSKKLPTLKELEDVNLGVFKLKPLPQFDPKFSPFNLDSHITKLPERNIMNLKPLKWQSQLRDNADLLSINLPKSATMVKPLWSFEKTAKPLEFPDLDGMRESMRSNIQSIINRNALPLGSVSTIPNDIKEHTEDALRNAEKTIKSLQKRPISNINVLGNSVKRPQDIIELASRTREDVEDKIKALHYDLNDRLSTMRANLFDHTRFEPLNAPMLKDQFRKFETTSKPRPKERKNSSLSNTFSDRSKAQIKKMYDPKLARANEGARFNGKDKSHNILGASSISVPKSVELPKLTFPKFPYFKNKINSMENKQNNLDLNEKRSELLRSSKPPNFQKKSTVEITFTTTPRTNPLSDPNNVFTGVTEYYTDCSPPNPRLKGRRINPFKSNSVKDSNGAPSEVSSTGVPALSSRADIDNSEEMGLSTAPASTVNTPRERLRSGPPLFRQLLKSNENDDGVLKFKSEVQPLDITVIRNGKQSQGNMRIQPVPSIEKSFLSKLRDAVRTRLSNLDSILDPSENNSNPNVSSPHSIQSSSNGDMTRSASENIETVIEEPLKENVSYKCRMVCTKE